MGERGTGAQLLAPLRELADVGMLTGEAVAVAYAYDADQLRQVQALLEQQAAAAAEAADAERQARVDAVTARAQERLSAADAKVKAATAAYRKANKFLQQNIAQWGEYDARRDKFREHSPGGGGKWAAAVDAVNEARSDMVMAEEEYAEAKRARTKDVHEIVRTVSREQRDAQDRVDLQLQEQMDAVQEARKVTTARMLAVKARELDVRDGLVAGESTGQDPG